MRRLSKALSLLLAVVLVAALMPLTVFAATPANNAKMILAPVPSTMVAGSTWTGKVTVQNTGKNTWTKAGAYALKNLGNGSKAAMGNTSIKTNKTISFTISVTAPKTPGTYTMTWRMVKGSTLFGVTLTKTIVVTAANASLSSIAVTTPASKLSYVVGEGLDLTGLVVTGTYSDGSKKPVAVVPANVTGFNSSKVAVGQVLTVTVGGKTTTFKVDVLAAGVVSVKATSATQLLVKFNVAVDKTDAVVLARYSIGGVAPASVVLAADQKSAVLTMGAAMSGTKLYIVNPILISGTNNTAIFTAVETYSDTVAPVVSKVEYTDYQTVKVTFSEPMQNLGVATYVQDGAAVAIVPSAFVAGDSSITYNIAPAVADKPITVTIVGALDQANNLINPNPLVLTFTKTKSDTTAPVAVDAVALSDTKVQVTFSEKLSANPTVTVGATNIAVTFPAYDATKDNKVFEGTLVSAATGISAIKVAAGFTDVSGNAGVAFSKLATFTTDTTKPTIVGTEVKTFGGKQYVVVHWSEAVTPGVAVTLAGTRVKDYIQYTFTAGAAAAPVAYTKANGADVDDAKAIMIDISTDAAYLNGAYSISLPAAYVADTASTPNASAAATISFTKGDIAATADTTAPTVNALPVLAAGAMTVVFSEDMDPATALNVANYKIGGVSIFSAATFVGDAKTVKLTVIPGTIAISGLYNVSVSGAKDKAGNLVVAYSNNITVTENVKPYITSAKLTSSSTIDVAFSEAVTAGSADFEVYVNNVKATLTVVAPASVSTITLTVSPVVASLSDNVQVKLVNAVADANGNTAVAGGLMTVTH